MLLRFLVVQHTNSETDIIYNEYFNNLLIEKKANKFSDNDQSVHPVTALSRGLLAHLQQHLPAASDAVRLNVTR